MARDDGRERLPLVLGPVSNGEFLPAATSPADIRLAEAVLERAGAAADRLGLDRRRFLQTTGGMAALLATVNVAACSGSSGHRAVSPGGTYHVHRVGSPDLRRPDRLPARRVPGSDTTVALLSDLPSTGESDDPIPFDDAEGTRQLVTGLTSGGASRLLLQNVLAPNFGALAARLEEMTRTVETGQVDAFKVYTAWGPGGHGFYLDDPAIGLPVVQHAHDLGVKVMCGHKGLTLLNFGSTWNQPRAPTTRPIRSASIRCSRP